MKRYLAIFGILFIGVIAGLIVRGIPIVLQVQAGGGIQADRNGDVNGDARLDMSDAVYLLLHIFRDGPQPVAFAQGLPDNAEQLLEEIANPCKERRDRYLRNGDGTTIDTCTGLMWLETTIDITGDGVITYSPEQGRNLDTLNWEDAVQFCDSLQFAGHADWRLPTAEEMVTLHQRPIDYRASPWREGSNPAIEPMQWQHWTSTESVRDPSLAWSWIPHREALATTDGKGAAKLILPVRSVQ